MRPARVRLIPLFALAAGVTVAGCEKTRECSELEKVKRVSQRALSAAKGRAALADRTGQSLQRIKDATEKKLGEHGLDLPEAEILARLEARAKSGSNVELERTVRPVAVEPGAGPALEPETETLFRFTFPAPDLEAAWQVSTDLMASPPLTRLFALIPPKRKGEAWRVELGRVDVQRMPMDIKPRPLPPRPSADDIEEEFGFCGASKLREEITAIEAEILEYKDKAEATTTNLPLSASWKGLSRRVDLSVDRELESRRLASILVDAVVKSRQKFAGLGVEEEAVLIEVEGDAKSLARVQKQMDGEALAALREIPGGRKGVARMAIGNRIAAAGRRPESGGAQPAPQPRMPGGSNHEHDGE